MRGRCEDRAGRVDKPTGRFHAFDLARELIRQGVEVTLLTNYPKYVAERFGIPREHVLNCVSHGVFSRLIERVAGTGQQAIFEPLLHHWFSRWAARPTVVE